MSIATLNVKVEPRRMLSLREAATYCGLTIKTFPSECPVEPIEVARGKRLYDIRDLDRWIDSMKSGGSGVMQDVLERLNQ